MKVIIAEAEGPSRLAFFILSSLSLFFFFFIYDSPSPMYPGLKSLFGSNYSSYHSLLYSAYALPNLLLPLIFTSAIGGSTARKMTYTYGLIVIGQLVMILGAVIKTFELMVVGRFIIGLGGESFSVAQNKMLSMLFRTNEHGRVFGISIAIGRLGSICSYLLLGQLIPKGVPLSAGICGVLIVIGGVCIAIIEWHWGELPEFSTEEIDNDSSHHYLLPHILSITILIACAVSPFSSASSAILQRRLSIDYPTTSRILALQEGVALCFTVLISIITDKIGHRLTCVTLGSIFLSFGHALIVLGTSLYYMPSVLIGISSGLLACCWPCIPLLIPPSRLSMGLSLLSCGVNLAYTICPALVSKLSDESFRLSEYYTTMVSVIVSLLSVYIVFVNSTRGYGLNGRRSLKI